MKAVSQRMQGIGDLLDPVYRFFTQSTYARRAGDPAIADFAVGNPHEMPLPEFANALARWSVPENKDWFAYKSNEPASRAIVATSLREQLGLPFEGDDIFLTNGAFAGISVVLGTIVDPGDEVIFISPPWFFYEALIAAAGATPVRVGVERTSFDLDLDAIATAVGPRTRAIIVNSPHNPTGKIYGRETLHELARILTAAGGRWGRPIYVISDEAYRGITFDGRAFHSLAACYRYTFVVYTYGKVLLTPGQRIGYIALPPQMPDREQLRHAIFLSQLMTGYAFPNALLQHALPDIERLTIDVEHLQRKRDRLCAVLRAMGYNLHVPEGTFYLLPRTPIADDVAFVERLAEHDIFCLPGAVVEMPGYFRLSLTATDTMIDRALPGFEAAIAGVRD